MSEGEILPAFTVRATGEPSLEMDWFSFDVNPDAKPDAPYPSDLFYRVEMWMLEESLRPSR